MSTAADKYKSLKVKELQELLTKNGLPHAGKKEELIERLVKHDEKQEKELASLDEEFGDLEEFDASKVNLDDISENVKPLDDAEIEDIVDETETNAESKPESTTTTAAPASTVADTPAPADGASSATTTPTTAAVDKSEPVTKPNSNFKFTPITFEKKPSTATAAADTTTATTTTSTTSATSATASPTTSTPASPANSATDAKVKPVDDAEKALERAKRFGIQLNEKAKKDIRAQRFGIVNNASKNTNSNKANDSKAKGGVDPEVLKKRAERFGISPKTAAVAANRGGKVPVKLDAAEEEKKRKRAERFGIDSNKKQKAE